MFSFFYNTVADILSPAGCAYCGALTEQRTVLCPSCINLITPIISTCIPINSTQSMNIHSVGTYQDPLRALILAKHRGNRVVSKQLGYLLWNSSLISQLKFDLVVPIPLHWTRYAQRGYNQAELIAHYVGTMTGKKIEHLLKRSKATQFQADLSGQERERNLKNAFSLSSATVRADYQNQHILLIDDLMTTGATLKAAAQALLIYNPASIQAMVAARTL